MKIKHLLFYSIFLAITSCFNDSNEKPIKEYDKDDFVSITTEKEDSVLEDKTFEYFANINLSDSICTWSRFYFYRDYDDLSFGEAAYIYDSLKIKFVLNDSFQISKILNYEEVYNKIKDQTDLFVNSTPESSKAIVTNIIENISLDSTNIINKNTQDITMFNIGFNYLFDESSIDTTIYQIDKQDKVDIITFGYSVDAKNIIDTFSNLLKFSNEIPNNNYNVTGKIVKDNIWNDLLVIEYTISFILDGIKHSTKTVIQKIPQV